MSETIVYLFIIFAGYNATHSVYRTPTASMEDCEKRLAAMRLQSGGGNEDENLISAFCGTSIAQLGRLGNGKFAWAETN